MLIFARCRRACRVIIKTQYFYWAIIVLVFLNTCVLSTEYHGQPEWLGDFQVKKHIWSKVRKIEVFPPDFLPNKEETF